MDIERLKELKEQIKGVHDGINGTDLHLLYDLLPLVDEAIARQSVKSEDVQEAIEYYVFNLADRLHDGKDEVTKRFETVITALKAYQPTTRKDRMVEEVVISKTETTTCATGDDLSCTD